MTKFEKFLSFIIPFEKYSVVTEDSREAVLERLEGSFSKSFFTRSEFYGHIKDDRFYARRNLNYKRRFSRVNNSFAPIVKGRISEGDDGKSKIDLTLRMHAISLGLVFFFICIFGMTLLTGLITVLFGEAADGGYMFVFSLLLLAFLELMIQPAFRIPAKKTKRRIEEIIDGTSPLELPEI